MIPRLTKVTEQFAVRAQVITTCNFLEILLIGTLSGHPKVALKLLPGVSPLRSYRHCATGSLRWYVILSNRHVSWRYALPRTYQVRCPLSPVPSCACGLVVACATLSH